MLFFFFFFKQKTAYEMRISDWSSDVCSSDLAGWKVRLSEMRGSGEMTPAHQTDGLAELVCSNSFRSDDAESNAVGMLHAEMRSLGPLIMREGGVHKEIGRANV